MAACRLLCRRRSTRASAIACFLCFSSSICWWSARVLFTARECTGHYGLYGAELTAWYGADQYPRRRVGRAVGSASPRKRRGDFVLRMFGVAALRVLPATAMALSLI